MKKILITFCLGLIFFTGYSQITVVMNSVASTASGNYSIGMLSAKTGGGIQISTNSAFNGSTGTMVLEERADGLSNWAAVKKPDDTTPVSFILSAGQNSYKVNIYTNCTSEYRWVYTAGNATLGNVRTVFVMH